MSNQSPTSAAAHEPKQGRARATLKRILDAGAELLAEAGFQGFGISEVCRRAEVSAGALYRYFESKEDLVLAIQDRELRRFNDEAAAALDLKLWRERRIDDVIDGAVRAVAANFQHHNLIVRAFIMHAGADPEMRRRSSHIVQEGLGGHFQRLLMTRAGELDATDPTAAVDGCFRLVFASLCWRVGFGAEYESSEANLDWDGWVDYLSETARIRLLHA